MGCEENFSQVAHHRSPMSDAWGLSDTRDLTCSTHRVLFTPTIPPGMIKSPQDCQVSPTQWFIKYFKKQHRAKVKKVYAKVILEFSFRRKLLPPENKDVQLREEGKKNVINIPWKLTSENRCKQTAHQYAIWVVEKPKFNPGLCTPFFEFDLEIINAVCRTYFLNPTYIGPWRGVHFIGWLKLRSLYCKNNASYGVQNM